MDSLIVALALLMIGVGFGEVFLKVKSFLFFQMSHNVFASNEKPNLAKSLLPFKLSIICFNQRSMWVILLAKGEQCNWEPN